MGKKSIELFVNGDRYEVHVAPWRSLAEVLREDLGLIGTKVGCNEGDCGACTVLLEGRSVASCLTLAVEADGLQVTTIEGLAPSPRELHPLQEAFAEKGAVQCGFCTAGMLMSAKHLLDSNSSPDEAAIRKGLSGNLCRCTGYNKIVDAIEHAAHKMAPKSVEHAAHEPGSGIMGQTAQTAASESAGQAAHAASPIATKSADHQAAAERGESR